MTEAVKTCKTCAHYRGGFLGTSLYSMCAAVVDPVSGGPGAFCDQRRDWGACGPEGKQWTPVPRRWWQFWRRG